MRYGRTRRRPAFNPFISLTDILFNLLLVLVFASAIFVQDIDRKYAENLAFQQRLAQMRLERDALIGSVQGLERELQNAEVLEEALREANTSLEEQIAGLVNNLDLAQIRQQRLEDRIRVVVGELADASGRNELLEERITVVLGDLGETELENRLLEDELFLITADLDEAERISELLREQVTELTRNNFLVVELEWLTEAHDLDLHVTDPVGHRYYWNRPSYAEVDSRLTLDNRIGARPDRPGLEIWTARELRLGTYRIEVGLWGCGRESELDSYDACLAPSTATVLVRHRDGDERIAAIPVPADRIYAQVDGDEFSLNEGLFGRLLPVAEVEVVEVDGEVRVEVRPAGGLTVEPLAEER